MDDEIGKELCPDCHCKVSNHDMYGCTLYACSYRRKLLRAGECELSGEFLREYFSDGK